MARPLVARNMVQHVTNGSEKRTSMNGRLKSPQVDSARRLRGIYFIDPEDGQYKATIKNARTKLEVLMEAAMRCKMGTKKHPGLQETEAKSG